MRIPLFILFIAFSASSCAQEKLKTNTSMSTEKKDYSCGLSPEQIRITQQKGTEPAFSGKYWDHHEKGMYACVVCKEPLFESDTKFDSGSGWPSFYAPVEKEKVGEIDDRSYGMVRTEIVCKKCGAHLGHVFDDGPAPTGLRYCVNSASLDFKGEGEAPSTETKE